jgi:hypothetical protein
MSCKNVSFRALVLLLALSLGLIVAAPLAQASDASLKHALKAYQTRLTSDIGYLASFKAPSKHGAGTALSKVSKIDGDLKGATKAARGQQGSSSAGRKGRTQILSALKDASAAASAAKASATAAQDGKGGAAKSDAKQERTDINKAIPLFEAGGKALHLF